MKIAIFEDEFPAAERLERLILEVSPESRVIAKLESLEDGEKWLKSNTPDLIFMDIHLSDGNAFKLFEKSLVSSPVVFCTAYDQYAIKAFNNYAIDYLLKPVTRETLKNSFDKIDFLQTRWNGINTNIQHLIKEITQSKPTYQKHFLVQYGQKIKSISNLEVAYFYANNKLVYLKTVRGEQFTMDQTIDQIEKSVNPEQFFRINRKFLISRQSIHEMYSYSKSRVNVKLSPHTDLHTIVSTDKSAPFKLWLGK